MVSLNRRRRLVGLLFSVVVAVLLPPFPLHGRAQAPIPSSSTALTNQQASATIRTYCGTCHNVRLRTADLVLDEAAFDQIPANAERWEKVVRKLQARSMPPPGAPRPDSATYDALRGYFETVLDRAAAASPNPGKLPPLHRLTRTEYQNAVRDLLALDALPQEMDYAMLLPQDNAMSGFDNIADLLFISPTAMESYLAAAEKISRLAIGDPQAPVQVSTYRMPDEEPQTSRTNEDLPAGTRGGLAIETTLPLDGEYALKVVFTGGSPEEQTLEISVDGERVRLDTIAPLRGAGEASGAGGAGGAGGTGGVGPTAAADPVPRTGREPIAARIPMKAGPRTIRVTFLERNEVRDEQILRPRLRGVGPALAVETVTISGPYGATGAQATPTRERVFVCRPASAADEAPCARRILSALTRRAYRRPSTDEDVQSLMPFYTAGRTEGGFEMGIQRAIQRLLVSPQFLFRIEQDPPGSVAGARHPITDLELASRLSFFLWSSIPDDELLSLASDRKLRQPRVLEQQVRRMLADERSMSLVTNFGEQWLYLRDIEAKKPNEILFPDFDESLRAALGKETVLFLDSVLRSNASVLELLSANYTFVNERLARHYGIPNIRGPEFQRVTFPSGSPRGGLLGQGSLLTITSYANRTSPVNRGKWVLENLLAAPPPPPPPNVPALKTEGNTTGKPLTMRDAMVQHRANPVCASCHARMDPIGFAMENFDPVGRWREMDAGNPIDASGVFPDGQTFVGTAGLKAALLSRPDEFVSTVTEKLLMYGLGRNVQYFDQPAIRAIVRESARSNYSFASLVMGVVKSAAFQMRTTSAVPEAKTAER